MYMYIYIYMQVNPACPVPVFSPANVPAARRSEMTVTRTASNNGKDGQTDRQTDGHGARRDSLSKFVSCLCLSSCSCYFQLKNMS